MASGASARVFENGCLKFVPATKTHDDISFAANHVSPPYLGRTIRHRFQKVQGEEVMV